MQVSVPEHKGAPRTRGDSARRGKNIDCEVAKCSEAINMLVELDFNGKQSL